MRRALSLLIIICMLPSLSGCGSIYSNYREMEQLLVLRTLGFDYSEGGVTLSLASGADEAHGGSPIRLAVADTTVSAAFDRAQNYSFEQSLFFPHISGVLIGEASAARGVDELISYICQSPRLRVDIPIYVVKNGAAAEAVANTGDDARGITEILAGVREYLELRGEDTLITAAELTRGSLRHGSALACALELTPSAELNAEVGGDSEADAAQAEEDLAEGDSAPSPAPSEQPTQRAYTVAAAGYAVFKDLKLAAYIDLDDALGVSFLKNHVGRELVVVKDIRGDDVTLEINAGTCDIRPLWTQEGELRRIDVSARVQASVLEINGTGDLSQAAYAAYLTEQLESYVMERINRVLRLSQSLGADFLALGEVVERSDASAFARLDAPFSQLLEGMELKLAVAGKLTHSDDIRQNLGLSDKKGGHAA